MWTCLCETCVWSAKTFPMAEFAAGFLCAENPPKKCGYSIFLVRENNVCFNFRTVVTLSEQFDACFFSRITDSHSVPTVSDCDYTLGYKQPAVELYFVFLISCDNFSNPAISRAAFLTFRDNPANPDISWKFFQSICIFLTKKIELCVELYVDECCCVVLSDLRILVMLLLDTLPMLGNVLLLCFFVFFIFGIVGVQLWAGLLRQRCVLQLPDNASVASWYIRLHQTLWLGSLAVACRASDRDVAGSTPGRSTAS